MYNTYAKSILKNITTYLYLSYEHSLSYINASCSVKCILYVNTRYSKARTINILPENENSLKVCINTISQHRKR